jgi:hypothetical protein
MAESTSEPSETPAETSGPAEIVKDARERPRTKHPHTVDWRALDTVLGRLRALAAPCEPPVGVGAFEVLYASEREIVVWYSPARAEHRPGEVTIPTSRLQAAWSVLVSGTPLDEAALDALGEGPAGGRWLLAVLAQLPGVAVRQEPLALAWQAPAPRDDEVAPTTSRRTATTRRERR